MRVLSALVGGCAALTLLAPTAAQAETWRHRDPSGDVRRLAPDRPPEGRPAPGHAASDLTRITVVHGLDQVAVTLQVRDLKPGPKGVFVELRTEEPGRWAIELVRLDDYSTFRLTRAGAAVDCPGLQKSRSVAADTVKVKLPRSCLGTPETVRAGAGMFTQAKVGTRADDALRDGEIGGRLALGPAVASG